MSLIKLDDSCFLDLGALVAVRFDGDAPESADVRLSTGASFALGSDAAKALRRHLLSDAVAGADATEDFEPTAGHSLISRKKSWFVRADQGQIYIIAAVNARGSCSIRTFDGKTGIFLGKQYRSGNYREQFADVLRGAREISVPNQPNLERDCRERLPESVLSHLKEQFEEYT